MKTELISEQEMGGEHAGLVFSQYRILPVEGLQGGEVHEYHHPEHPATRVVNRIMLLNSGWMHQAMVQHCGETIVVSRERLNNFIDPKTLVKNLSALLTAVFFPSNTSFTLAERVTISQSDGHSV